MKINFDHNCYKGFPIHFTIKSRCGLELLFLWVSLTVNSQVIEYDYPTIKTETAVNIYFADTITDAYRSLEKDSTPVIQKWYNDQNALALSILKNIEGRKELMKTYLNYDKRGSDFVSLLKITPAGSYFYLKQLAEEDVAKLYYRKRFESPEIQLYDPSEYKYDKDLKFTINYLNPSWDGSKIVLALSTAGKEISDLITIKVENIFIDKEVLHNAWPASFLGVSWLPDNSGFTYLYFPQGTSPSEQEEKSFSVLHLISDVENKLIQVFGSEVNKDLNIPSSGVYPIANILDANDHYVIGYIATVDNYWDAYYCKMEDFQLGDPQWKKLYSKTDKVYAGSEIFRGDELFFKSGKESSNYQICMVDMTDLNIEEPAVVKSSFNDETITDFKIVHNQIFIATSKNGVEAKMYTLVNKNLKSIQLPSPAGYLEMTRRPGDKDALWITIAGWTNDYQRYKYESASSSFKIENLSPKAAFPEFKDIITEEIEIPSHDGVKMPVSIIHSRNMKKDSRNPILFYGYGAYGTSIEPFYSSFFLEWVRQGGILCIPHVRGGGEKGDEWRKAGFMETKENTWKDLIAAIKFMHAQKYSCPDKTIIYSSSAGGIMVGMAMIDEPQLIKALIAEVPQMNPSRTSFKDDGGGSNELEYGSLTDSSQSSALIRMDPYLNLKRGEDYPAIFITAGANDPRIPLWIPGKFIAKAQEYSSSRNPILFRVDQDAGHGNSEDYLKYYQDYADIFSFAFWQTGHPGFKLNDSITKVLKVVNDEKN